MCEYPRDMAPTTSSGSLDILGSIAIARTLGCHNAPTSPIWRDECANSRKVTAATRVGFPPRGALTWTLRLSGRGRRTPNAHVGLHPAGTARRGKALSFAAGNSPKRPTLLPKGLF